LAIDFAMHHGSDPSRADGDPLWEWLTNHAAKYGFYQYSAEAWHWSPTGN